MATCSVVNASAPNKSKLEETQSKEITVNFGVFFDGTNNQRLQVAMGKLNREKNSKKEKEKIEKDIERLGGTFDEEQFKKNGNIKYTLSNLPSDKEKEIEKLNKKVAKYNKKHGNLPNANEHETINSFTWDEASGVKKDEDTIEQALDKKDGFRIGMPRSPMQGVDFTNIARLEPSYKEQPSSDYTYKIYVSGSGTFADLDKGIDITGLAAGQNSAGVVQKVKDALDAIAKIIVKINSPDNKIERVKYKFNVFGFSRGATEARLFVDLCSKVRDGKRPKLLDDIISVYNHKFNTEKEKKSVLSAISFGKQISIEFPFVGLFDTVSSVGINPGIWNNVVISGGLKVAEEATPSVSNYHKNNKNDLGLDTLVYDSNVKHIVHICALDEFRENFALQVLPISSSKVEQFFLPGVHADIGGGDLDGYGDEKYIPTVHRGKTLYIPKMVTPGVSQKKQNLLEINLNNLKCLGWAKDSSDSSSLMPDITGEEKGVIKLQKYTERGYTYLPLNIMAEKACEKSCEFDNLKGKYAIPSDLPQSFSAIQTEWNGDDSKYGHCYSPEDSVYKLLRQRRLHFSSCIKKTAGLAYVNGPNLTESDDKESPVPYYDRFLDYQLHPKGWYGKITKSGLTDIVFEEAGNKNNDDYLGEAVVVFKSKNEKYTILKTKKGQKINEYKFIKLPDIKIKNGKKHYREEEIIEIIDGVPAEVIIYGKANNKNDAYNKSFVGMTKPSVKGSTTLNNGNYYAYKRQMDNVEKAYRNEAYLIVNNRKNESNDGLNNNMDSFIANMTLWGKKDGKEKTMDGVYLHRTNWDGNATLSSEGCLIIDGRDWGEVDGLLGQSQDVFIHLNRS